MTLEETTQLYATVLRQLLPRGGYDSAHNTVVAADVYAHAKVLAQADLDAKRLLKVLESIPTDLMNEYETEYGLPLKCTTNVGRTIEERLQIFRWFKNTENVVNRAYLEQLLALFGIELFELKTYRPMQCTASCTAPVNTEQLRYKVRIVIPEPVPADTLCVIENYLPAYLRIDVLSVPITILSSKPYPYYFIESVSSGFSITGAVQRTVMNETSLSENVSTSFAITSATIREANSSYTAEVESVATGFAMTAAQITKEVRYLSATVDIENVSTSFAMTGAQITKTVGYLTNTADIENVSTSFAMTDAQITN